MNGVFKKKGSKYSSIEAEGTACMKTKSAQFLIETSVKWLLVDGGVVKSSNERSIQMTDLALKFHFFKVLYDIKSRFLLEISKAMLALRCKTMEEPHNVVVHLQLLGFNDSKIVCNLAFKTIFNSTSLIRENISSYPLFTV